MRGQRGWGGDYEPAAVVAPEICTSSGGQIRKMNNRSVVKRENAYRIWKDVYRMVEHRIVLFLLYFKGLG